MDARILAIALLLASVMLVFGCIGGQKTQTGGLKDSHPISTGNQVAGGSLGDSEISPATPESDDQVLSEEDVIPPSDEGAVTKEDGLSGQSGESGRDPILLTDSDILVTDIPEGDLISLEDVVEPG